MPSESQARGLPLVVIAGPTAVGKSDLAVKLAGEVDGEIISADSMQIYRGMDIGSAKVTKEEMQGIPHHLIDALDPWEPFDVTVFQGMAKECIRQITDRGRIPILTGGTGFYLQSVLYDIDFTQTSEDTALRRELADYARTHGAQALHQRLQQVDPRSAKSIHPNNLRRVIRALEYHAQTGASIQTHNEAQRRQCSPYHLLFFVLTDDRKALYERINHRVDAMMDKGLLEEVKALSEHGCDRSMQSMQGIGYKELLAYLEGACSLEEAVEQIKTASRHYAKRQLTWFRREQDVIWLDRSRLGEQDILQEMKARMISAQMIGAETEISPHGNTDFTEGQLPGHGHF